MAQRLNQMYLKEFDVEFMFVLIIGKVSRICIMSSGAKQMERPKQFDPWLTLT